MKLRSLLQLPASRPDVEPRLEPQVPARWVTEVRLTSGMWSVLGPRHLGRSPWMTHGRHIWRKGTLPYGAIQPQHRVARLQNFKTSGDPVDEGDANTIERPSARPPTSPAPTALL